uniref:Uncharacterized protein n=1 Tax=Oryza meridionalis TaxID=40149 RepID=A0A0E0DWN7_9ORYZ
MATVTRAHLEQRLALAKRCSREANIAGVKAAAVATIASAVPTVTGEREDAAMGEGQHQPDGSGADHLHGGRDGLLRRRRQEDPLAGEEALLRERT